MRTCLLCRARLSGSHLTQKMKKGRKKRGRAGMEVMVGRKERERVFGAFSHLAGRRGKGGGGGASCDHDGL